jgi:hypothetical protein
VLVILSKVEARAKIASTSLHVARNDRLALVAARFIISASEKSRD